MEVIVKFNIKNKALYDLTELYILNNSIYYFRDNKWCLANMADII